MSAGIPAWVRAVVRVRRVVPPLGRSVRGGLCVGIPVAVGFAVDEVSIGVTVGLACVLRTIGEREGSHRLNATALLIATPIAACGYLAGPLQDLPLLALVALMAAFAFVAGTLAPHGEGFAVGGMQVLLVASIALGVPDTGTASAVGWFLVGAAIYGAAMAVDFLLLEPKRPERIALEELDEAIAAMQASPGTPRRHGAHAALAAARRIPPPGWVADESGVARWGAYAVVVDAADDLVAWEGARGIPDPDRRSAYGDAREAWSAGRSSGGPSRPRPTSLDAPTAPRPTWRGRLLPDPATRAHAGRLALCFGLAVSSRGWIGLDHWFWVPATVGLVMQPDFGSVFGRAVLRVGGTIAGSALAAAILWAVPDGVALGLAIGLVAAAIPWSKQASYVMQSLALAAVVLLLVDQIAPTEGTLSLPVQRVLATMAGGVIVLVFGYLIWPAARHVSIRSQMVSATTALAVLLRTSAEPVPADDGARAARRATDVTARQHAFDALAATRTPLERAAAEPPPASIDAASWAEAVTAVEELGVRISDHAIARLAGLEPPESVEDLATEIEALGRSNDPSAVTERARRLVVAIPGPSD